MNDFLDALDNAPLSLDDAFDIWARTALSKPWLSSPWWYLHRGEVRRKFVSELLRELRQHGRFGVVGNTLVPVESSTELMQARAEDRLTEEEMDMLC